MGYCDVCDCNVPSGNWQQHIDGRRHQENSNQSDDDDYDCDTNSNCDSDSFDDNDASSDDDDCYLVVSARCVYYTQDSIGNAFKDGTTLEEGVANLQQDIPEAYRTNRWWDADFSVEHVVEVYDMGDGHYTAKNNRTLFCYEQAGFLWVPVLVIGNYSRRFWYTTDYPYVRGESSF